MRTGLQRSTLLARLARLESRVSAASQRIKLRFGHLRRLPADYEGEKHVVIAKELPSQNGQEWVEYEEVPGPDPNAVTRRRAGEPEYMDIVFVESPRRLCERIGALDEVQKRQCGI